MYLVSIISQIATRLFIILFSTDITEQKADNIYLFMCLCIGHM